MRQLTESEYKNIKALSSLFYAGVEIYCETLQDTDIFIKPFETIMAIIENAEKV